MSITTIRELLYLMFNWIDVRTSFLNGCAVYNIARYFCRFSALFAHSRKSTRS